MKDPFHPPKIVDCLVHLVIVKISRHGEKKSFQWPFYVFSDFLTHLPRGTTWHLPPEDRISTPSYSPLFSWVTGGFSMARRSASFESFRLGSKFTKSSLNRKHWQKDIPDTNRNWPNTLTQRKHLGLAVGLLSGAVWGIWRRNCRVQMIWRQAFWRRKRRKAEET